MKTKRLYYWLGLATFLLIIWGLFGHFVCRIGYSTQKPINYDQPKEDTNLYGHSEILRLDTAD